MKKKSVTLLSLILAMLLVFTACGGTAEPTTPTTEASVPTTPVTEAVVTTEQMPGTERTTVQPVEPISDSGPKERGVEFSYDLVPEYVGSPYAVINNNEPFFVTNGFNFTEIYSEYTKGKVTEKEIRSFEYYGDFDSLGRCTACVASLGKDIMPKEDRGDISSVHPTGWSGNPCRIYNRCHLIGFQLAGENANKNNLVTGTQYMNVSGMLPFENMAADYIKETGNHIMYRITPVFVGSELVARGVLMEAYSVEDDGDGVCYCVFCYNVQNGYKIDYATGECYENDVQTTSAKPEVNTNENECTYILNLNTNKFHSPGCSAAKKIAENNRAEFGGSREQLISDGYQPCGICKP